MRKKVDRCGSLDLRVVRWWGLDRGGAGAHLARKHLPFWKSRHMGWFACAAGCEPSWLLCA